MNLQFIFRFNVIKIKSKYKLFIKIKSENCIQKLKLYFQIKSQKFFISKIIILDTHFLCILNFALEKYIQHIYMHVNLQNVQQYSQKYKQNQLKKIYNNFFVSQIIFIYHLHTYIYIVQLQNPILVIKLSKLNINQYQLSNINKNILKGQLINNQQKVCFYLFFFQNPMQYHNKFYLRNLENQRMKKDDDDDQYNNSNSTQRIIIQNNYLTLSPVHKIYLFIIHSNFTRFNIFGIISILNNLQSYFKLLQTDLNIM
eukprot:TRINITY_DN18714_c0_g1_i1.p1 TRINITY_DN18714_c0_g1~~TRINITY_DN18714_c0_g1_i1.p1  ORF type:complete len:256 (-),score=-29.97 TRINITY_DN18714_c0_g1_i1:316-1083(-)